MKFTYLTDWKAWRACSRIKRGRRGWFHKFKIFGFLRLFLLFGGEEVTTLFINFTASKGRSTDAFLCLSKFSSIVLIELYDLSSLYKTHKTHNDKHKNTRAGILVGKMGGEQKFNGESRYSSNYEM